MSILVLGTVALDNVKTPFGFKKNILGGSAAHFSMSARLFTEVHLSAIVGSNFPQKYIGFLSQKGIILDSLIRSEGKTFEWHGEYRSDLNTAFTLNTELGVLSSFRPSLSARQKKIKYIFLANVDPDIQSHLLGKMHSPLLIGMDSMNYWIKHKRQSLLRLLKKVDIYVANDQEARDLSGQIHLVKAAKYLKSLGPRIVVVKKGEHGAILLGDNLIFSLPGYPTDRVIDPTGAGDTFAGGFMGYLAKTKKINAGILKKAAAYGTIAASFNVEGFGLEKTSRITKRDLEIRLTDFKKGFLF